MEHIKQPIFIFSLQGNTYFSVRLIYLLLGFSYIVVWFLFLSFEWYSKRFGGVFVYIFFVAVAVL